MQIDVLSQNTLKLTLSRLDMFDMDIRYESLSGKNPDTKRLLSHVLRTVKLDKSAGVDFSGERLFVEAFPRPDGGCMLYISSLFEENKESYIKDTSARTPAKQSVLQQSRKPQSQLERTEQLLCHLNSIKDLEGVCKNLSWQRSNGKVEFTSTLYGNNAENRNHYRLLIRANNKKLITAIVNEYGELLNVENELPFTCERYNVLISDNAAEQILSVS
jgi:negative regulator of genetic competence, sporulation and motility